MTSDLTEPPSRGGNLAKRREPPRSSAFFHEAAGALASDIGNAVLVSPISAGIAVSQQRVLLQTFDNRFDERKRKFELTGHLPACRRALRQEKLENQPFHFVFGQSSFVKRGGFGRKVFVLARCFAWPEQILNSLKQGVELSITRTRG